MAVFEPLFRALNDGGVRYVVVGGLAVVLHGHARLTVDVDLVVDLDEVEAMKAIDVLIAAGLWPRVPVDPRGFADPNIRQDWIRNRRMQVFSMFDPSNPLRAVDLFVDHQLPFSDLWSRSELVDIGGTMVRVASIADLIHLKRLSARPLDLDDIQQLEAIRNRRQGDADG
jgi:predicted nucleotidyltransferase